MRSALRVHALLHTLEFHRSKHVLRGCAAIAAGLSATILMSGCGVFAAFLDREAGLARVNAFVYQGKTYETREEAEAAQKVVLSHLLGQVEPLGDPVAGRARIIVPNKDAILQRQRTISGSEAEGNDYRATARRDNIRTHADAIGKRNLFLRYEIVETNHPDHVAPVPDMAIVYFYVSPAGEWTRWYYVSKTMPRTPIHPEGARNATQWMKSFLIELEAVALKDKTK